MTIVNIILVILLIAVATVFVAALFVKPQFSLEREIVIARPVQQVFDYIRPMKNQEHYNKWVMTDPGMKKSFSGTDGTVGAVYSWDSKNGQVGKGAQEIVKIADNQRIDYEIRFEKPFQNTSQAYLTTEPAGEGQTRVRYGFIGENAYMMRVMHVLLNLKKVLGKDMQTTLERLKAKLEH